MPNQGAATLTDRREFLQHWGGGLGWIVALPVRKLTGRAALSGPFITATAGMASKSPGFPEPAGRVSSMVGPGAYPP